MPSTPRVVYTPQQLADTIGARNYDDLCTWLHKNVPYKTDRTAADEWKEPEDTLKDGYGDCEDIASVAREVLRIWGVQDDYILGVMKVGRNYGHVVCFFRDVPTDEWRFFSNDDASLHRGGFNLPDLVRSVGSIMRYGSNLEYKLANRDNVEITKEEEAAYGLV